MRCFRYAKGREHKECGRIVKQPGESGMLIVPCLLRELFDMSQSAFSKTALSMRDVASIRCALPTRGGMFLICDLLVWHVRGVCIGVFLTTLLECWIKATKVFIGDYRPVPTGF